ncbi:MAG: transporter, partial [Xanthobacteraceae bacterium]|nr:transporter [Xanthobacteraceae bacterium]
MSPLGGIHQPLRRVVASLIAVLVVLTAGAIDADADEAGISFWVPGTYGALAAAPLPQGFSLAEVYYHSPVKAGADVATAIQIPRAGILTKLPATLDFHLGVQTDLMLSIPTYVFATPVFGGQLSVGLLIPYGRNKVAVDQTLIGPKGGSPPGAGGPLIDSVSGLGDLEPQTSLRWNFGVHNFMVYLTGDIPVGLYSPVQLANIGYGHGAIDGGSGYTYFNEKTGNEFSAVLGLTYNFINPSTQYQNGVDVHFDWSASKFVTKQI